MTPVKIIADKTLDYRRDNRSAETHAANLETGSRIEKAIVDLLISQLPDNVTYTHTPQDTVDSRADLVIHFEGYDLGIEIQTAKKAFTGYGYPCFHLKETKVDAAKKFLSQNPNNRMFYLQHFQDSDAIYFIPHNDVMEKTEVKTCPPLGDKPGRRLFTLMFCIPEYSSFDDIYKAI